MKTWTVEISVAGTVVDTLTGPFDCATALAVAEAITRSSPTHLARPVEVEWQRAGKGAATLAVA